MRLNEIQLMCDICFIMKQRSAKWWRTKELVEPLRQLGHESPTVDKVKWSVGQLWRHGYLERIKVKKQWTLYSYRFIKEYTHPDAVKRIGDNIW